MAPIPFTALGAHHIRRMRAARLWRLLAYRKLRRTFGRIARLFDSTATLEIRLARKLGDDVPATFGAMERMATASLATAIHRAKTATPPDITPYLNFRDEVERLYPVSSPIPPSSRWRDLAENQTAPSTIPDALTQALNAWNSYSELLHRIENSNVSAPYPEAAPYLLNPPSKR